MRPGQHGSAQILRTSQPPPSWPSPHSEVQVADHALAAAGTLIEAQLHCSDLEAAQQRWGHLITESEVDRSASDYWSWGESVLAAGQLARTLHDDHVQRPILPSALPTARSGGWIQQFQQLAAVPAALEWFTISY